MSPICKTFVQNAWKKDLCSNCFKSEEEHGSAKNEVNGSRKDYCYNDANTNGRRYVSVAGRPGLYSRNYYGSKSWNPLMLDNSHNDSRLLRSPGLIKGMDSIIKQENEKNRNFNSCLDSTDEPDAPLKTAPQNLSKTNLPKDSWILSQIIGEPTAIKDADRSERLHGDSSSDLGSDASHDTSGNTSACSEGDPKGDSDASSVKSEPDSAHEDEPPVRGILKATPSITLARTLRASISFNEQDQVIGYGGDVDYSDEEDEDDYDDDDDDNSSISSAELGPKGRRLKRLTERNTNFNSENENLEKDRVIDDDDDDYDDDDDEDDDDSLTSYDLLSAADDSQTADSRAKQGELSNRQDVKVKLKRSHPIAGTKPQIRSNFSSSYGVSVPSSLSNTQSGTSHRETIPMQGIKPKFVSREDEMRENTKYEEIYQNNHRVTSIDDIAPKLTSIDDIVPKVKSIDDIVPKFTSIDDITPKITSVDDIKPKFTSIDDIIHKATPGEVIQKTACADEIKQNMASKSQSEQLVTSPKSSTNDLTDKTVSDNQVSDDISNNLKLVKKDLSAKVENNILKTTTVSNSPPITYVEDISTYKCPSSNEVVSNKSTDFSTLPTKEVRAPSVKSNQENFKRTENSTNLDYSVKSSPLPRMEGKASQKAYTTVQKDSSSCLRETEKEKLEKVSSAVIPLNMITIQRRSSFMESQLGGETFSIESPVTKSSSSGSLEGSIDSRNAKPISPTGHKEELSNIVAPPPQQSLMELEDYLKHTEPNLVKNKDVVPQTKMISVQSNDVKGNVNKNKEIMKENTKEKGDFNGNKEIIKDTNINDSKVVMRENIKKSTEVVTENRTNASVKETKNNANHTQWTADIEKLNGEIEFLKCPQPVSKPKESNPEADITCKAAKSPEVQKSSSREVVVSKDTSEEGPKKLSINSSNSLSTFGTPVSPTSAPNSSFLHSGAVRPVTESNEINSIIFSTPEFLKDIKPHAPQPAVTACIQKSALYAPSSCLKGVPLGKPATTPKPIYLKDKPKVPVKPYVSSPVYTRQASIPKKQEEPNTPTSDPPVNNIDTVASISSKPIEIIETASYDNIARTSPSQESCIPNLENEKEVVYDVPVTLSSTSTATFSAPSPTSSSSGYSTTSNLSQSDGNLTYQDNKENFTDSLEKNEDDVGDFPVRAEPEVECLYRARFEAARNILSESLSFENKPIKLDVTEQDEAKDTEIKETAFEEPKEEVIEEEKKEEPETLSVPKDRPSEAFIPRHVSPSYVNLEAVYDNHDVDSYSSFTDDFDDDDDDDEDYKTNKREFLNIDNREKYPPLRRTERSSSATPLFRNSVGPIAFSPTCSAEASSQDNVFHTTIMGKPPAIRSQSVPRSTENAIDPSVFGKNKTESTSKFGFVRSGFFRPSSPPSTKRKVSSERGRDRTKKSHSVFSLRKLLRFGSGDKTSKAGKENSLAAEQEKNCRRETRKMKLQIIHPLDYNTNGVEVITRPEKRSPTYDFTGINDPLIQEALRQHALDLDEKKAAEASVTDGQLKEDPSAAKTKLGKVAKKNSFLKKRRKPERHDSERSEVITTTYVRPSYNSARHSREDVNRYSAEDVRKNSKEDVRRNSREDNSSSSDPRGSSVSISNFSSTQSGLNLGFNSEGRPRPPPPPRKTSLDANAQETSRDSMKPPRHHSESSFPVGSSSGSKTEGDTSSVSSTSSSTRPHRPPPPRRTPSTSGPRSKDSLYANLGNARASFTPRKPGRTASIRDEEREKRRAPNPPPQPQQPNNKHYQKQQPQQLTQQLTQQHAQQHAQQHTQQHQQSHQQPQQHPQQQQHQQQQQPQQLPQQPQQQQIYQQRHQQQTQVKQVRAGFKDELSQVLQVSGESQRSIKGPAPPAPPRTEFPVRTHDYEYISNSPDKFGEVFGLSSESGLYDIPMPLLKRHKTHEQDGSHGGPGSGMVSYSSRVQKEKASPRVDAPLSSPSSGPEKTARQRGRRGSVVTNLSLEDQYGAVVFANLEALSNMLDQMCSHTDHGRYERVKREVTSCSDLRLTSRDPIACALRLFYPATVAGCEVTVMVTPETKVEFDPLLMPHPILKLKDDIPAAFLPSRKASDHSFTSGSLWVLPKMTLCSPEEFSQASERLLQERATDWERRICLWLLQVVSALKQLQAKGIEEASLDMLLVITSIHGDDNPRLLMASSAESNNNNSCVTLCHCAAAATQLLLGHSQPLEAALQGPVLAPPSAPSPHAFAALISTLREERSSSLTKAKCILETMLFGPEDLTVSSAPDGESSLQKWLDLERASVLHSLVREQAAGALDRGCVATKFHLLFLVRTSVKSLREAIKALQAPDVTNF